MPTNVKGFGFWDRERGLGSREVSGLKFKYSTHLGYEYLLSIVCTQVQLQCSEDKAGDRLSRVKAIIKWQSHRFGRAYADTGHIKCSIASNIGGNI